MGGWGCTDMGGQGGSMGTPQHWGCAGAAHATWGCGGTQGWWHPRVCCRPRQGWGDPRVPRPRPLPGHPVPGTHVPWATHGSTLVGAGCHRAGVLHAPAVPPCPAALLAPGAPQTPFQGHRGPHAILGPERGVLDKGGSRGGGWCSSSFPAGTKAKQTESVSVSVSVSVSMPVSVPVSMSVPVLLPGPCGRLAWQRAMPWGRPLSPLPHQVPVGTPAPCPAGPSPGVPPGPPLAAGIGAMAFQLEERWRRQCVLRCYLPPSLRAPGVPAVAWSPGMPHPSRMGVGIPRGAASPH